MKYTVTSGSQFYTIGTASTIEEAMKLYDQHLDHDPSDDACIWDENHHDVGDWLEFVGNIIDNDTTGELVPMTAEDASTTLAGWQESGVEIPAGLTAEALQQMWNYILEEDEKYYQQCVREDDEASYQETIREAASYEPPVREEDPRLNSLQTLLDCAKGRRDGEWAAYSGLKTSEHPNPGMLDALEAAWLRAEEFYNGISMAILAAGYALDGDNVCKL